MPWIDQSTVFAFGATLTGSDMQVMRDNMLAITDGDSGAPKIKSAGMVYPHVHQHQPTHITITSSTKYIEFPSVFSDDLILGFIGRNIVVTSHNLGNYLPLYAQATNDNGSTWITYSGFYYGNANKLLVFTVFPENFGAPIAVLTNEVNTSQLPYNIYGHARKGSEEIGLKSTCRHWDSPTSLNPENTNVYSVGFDTSSITGITGYRLFMNSAYFLEGEFYTFRSADREEHL